MMMVVVPAFSQRDQCEKKIVPALVGGLVALGPKQVREGINRTGSMEEQDCGDKKAPNQHLHA